MTDEQQTSPYARSQSPASDISPTVALSPCPALDRSISTGSSVASSVSGRSNSGQLSDGGHGRRRGYMRPQATVFADSARNRDSVMSLGSIHHLQHYFARTGLLDGKGAQLARDQTKEDAANPDPAEYNSSQHDPFNSFSTGYDPSYAASSQSDYTEGDYRDAGFSDASSDNSASLDHWEGPQIISLPPTYSTYRHKPTYVPPPPDLKLLRRELREALDEASKMLLDLDQSNVEAAVDPERNPNPWPTTPGDQESQGWYEIQGLRVLDLVTLAIRAAKNYYTAHEQPQRLYAIKSERRIRSDLYAVLDVLKRMATRNFSGGLRKAERQKIQEWITSIDDLLSKEKAKEKEECDQREAWTWREGNWEGRERDREWLFLKSFDSNVEPLPSWTDPTHDESLPTPFLSALRTGLQLVFLHNSLVKASKRQFEEIKSYHMDTAKPYRCMDNLRYWIKAAELRWDVRLEVDVAAIVQGTNRSALIAFDEAVLKWCRVVREELTSEWKAGQAAAQSPSRPPVVQISEAYAQSSVV